jgi:hypothetical protein
VSLGRVVGQVVRDDTTANRHVAAPERSARPSLGVPPRVRSGIDDLVEADRQSGSAPHEMTLRASPSGRQRHFSAGLASQT